MARKRKIGREDILKAALELIKNEGTNQFTARRVAEYLEASTQPIYNEFKNMDDLREHLLDYVRHLLQHEVFRVQHIETHITEGCTNYIRFAKKEATLFSALFTGKELPVDALHECTTQSLEEIAERTTGLEGKTTEDRQALLDIIWPSIHGVAVLTAQGQYNLKEKELVNKVERIVTHSISIWEDRLVKKV